MQQFSAEWEYAFGRESCCVKWQTRNDRTVEIFRRNKVEMRMQLLKGTQQERRQILHAAIVVSACGICLSSTEISRRW